MRKVCLLAQTHESIGPSICDGHGGAASNRADKVNALGWVKICLCRGHSAVCLSTRHLPKVHGTSTSFPTLSWLLKGIRFLRLGLCLRIYCFSREGAGISDGDTAVTHRALMALPPGRSHAPQHPAFLPGASTLLCPQLVRKSRAPSATVSTLGWQSPSLGHPVCRAALSPHLTPPCVSHCTPGSS